MTRPVNSKSNSIRTTEPLTEAQPIDPPESQTASSCTTAGKQPGERRARTLGATRNAVPEYVYQYKKRWTKGRVASNGSRNG